MMVLLLQSFYFGLKKNYKKQNVNEISAQEKLLQFRKKIRISNF